MNLVELLAKQTTIYIELRKIELKLIATRVAAML